VRLLHIAHQADWDAACTAGVYSHPSLDAEGFIHLSTDAQVDATGRRFFAGATDLVLLEIDPATVAGQIRWERAADADEDFPHLYGPLPIGAVIGARPWAAPG
jgi:uncharacterized protein (DUF952 family)